MLVSVLLGGVGVFLAVVTYVPLGFQDESLFAGFGAAMSFTPGMFFSSFPIVLATSVVAALVWPTRYRPAVVLVAAIGGGIFGHFAGGHSPHISQRLATLSGAFAWTITAAAALLVLDRRRGVFQ